MSASQSAVYSETQAKKAGLTLARLGLASWETQDVMLLQAKVGAKPADGWFGPASIEAWKNWAKKNESQPVHDTSAIIHADLCGTVIIGGQYHRPPDGVKVVNFMEPGGVPAQKDDTSERKHPVFQFVIHRGAESHMKGENYAQATERVLDARGLSTTFSMDIDGTIYQHFDPAIRRGRHCTYHNVQSDSIDIGGPFTSTLKPEQGQALAQFQAAIGRSEDHVPPMTRKYGNVKCWSLPKPQVAALAKFLTWYCPLRGIPLLACEDMRTFRLSGDVGVNDPVTNVKGILAHAQISEPGARVDGLLELLQVKESGLSGITWRSGADFFKT